MAPAALFLKALLLWAVLSLAGGLWIPRHLPTHHDDLAESSARDRRSSFPAPHSRATPTHPPLSALSLLSRLFAIHVNSTDSIIANNNFDEGSTGSVVPSWDQVVPADGSFSYVISSTNQHLNGSVRFSSSNTNRGYLSQTLGIQWQPGRQYNLTAYLFDAD
ncbi:uncharacterized protein MONBRDRAFT_30136, partial [Monosiga brevicollis MX1]